MGAPLRAFLSYRRGDAEEASELQRQFGLRGLPLWCDVNDLPLGGLGEPEMRRGIRTSDAFVIYVTPRIFASDVIWRVEVPAALAHACRTAHNGRVYPIVPILRGVTHQRFREECARRGAPELGDRHAIRIAPGVIATKARRREAFAHAGTRLMRTLLPSLPAGGVAVLLRSFDIPERTRRGLDVNWSAAIDSARPVDWTTELLPALHDLKVELARTHRRDLFVRAQCRLALALSFGIAFPLASSFRISVRDRQGGWDRAMQPPLQRADHADLRSRHAVVEISLTQDASHSAKVLAASFRARRITLTPAGGPSRNYDPRPHAGAIAMQVGELARELRSQGATHLHLIYSGPAALALVVGRHLHNVGTVHTYYRSQSGKPIEAFACPS